MKQRWWWIAKVLAVFVVLGPLVGLAVFATAMSALVVGNGQTDGVLVGPFFLIYGVVFAHFIGAPWAALAGLIAAGTSRLLDRTSVWIGPASGFVSFVFSSPIHSGWFPTRTDAPIAQPVNGFAITVVGVGLLIFVVSATVCWMIARPCTWHQRQ